VVGGGGYGVPSAKYNYRLRKEMDNHQNEIEKGCTEIEDEAREDVWNGDGTRVAIVRTAKTWMSHSAGLGAYFPAKEKSFGLHDNQNLFEGECNRRERRIHPCVL
jgi:hypothetical protein